MILRTLFFTLFVATGLALGGELPEHTARRAAKDPPKAMVPAIHPDKACHSCHDDPHKPEAEARTCDSCHEATAWTPTFSVEDHAETAFPLEGAHPGVGCEQCHTGARLTGLPTECSGCHIDRHRGKLGGNCEECHTVERFVPVEGFDHDKTGFHLDGSHTGVSCSSCHKGEHGDAMRLVATATCGTCHGQDHAEFADKPCTDCHETTHSAFAAGVFDHRATSWPLERRHKAQDCKSCHPVDQAHTPSDRCMDCHTDPHSRQLGTRCEDCHRPDRWNLTRFDHDMAGWPLRGRHSVAACVDCHTAERWIGLTTSCWDCHGADAARAPANVPAHRWVRSDCSDCHGSWTWR